MEVDLLDFVEQCRRLVKTSVGESTRASPPAAGSVGTTIVLHCLRLEDGHSYRRNAESADGIWPRFVTHSADPDDLPDYSTIYRSFDRLKMWVWRALLPFPRSSTRSPNTLRSTARSSTGDVRHRAFVSGQDETIQTLKVTTLTDVESLAVLDVHIAARWKHDTKTPGRPPKRGRPAVGYRRQRLQDWHTKYGSPHTTSITSFIIAARQRTQPRKTFSTGQKLLSAVDGRNIVFDNEALARRRRASEPGLYRQFREIVLMFAITNIEPLCEPL